MKHRLMVVDDESQVREALCLYLEKRGYEVCSAASSGQTLVLLESAPVDLVILDIGLAEEDGLRLLPTLKSEYPKLKVIMLTGMGFLEDLLEEAQQKGADGYVSKALPLDELVREVEKILSPEKPQRAGGKVGV